MSRLVLGCADLKDTALLDAALDAGVNTFDTAHVYGGSEALLGRWLKGRDLSRLVIETKGCHPGPLHPDRVTPACLRKDVETSLRRLGVDCIDLFLLHRDSRRAEVGEIVETLNDLRKQGKLRAFGGSNWTAERIQEANDYAAAHGLAPFTVSSPHFGLACQIGDPWGGGAGCVTLTGKGQEKERVWYRESGTAVLAFSSLARGLLSGKISSADPNRADKLDAAGRPGVRLPGELGAVEPCGNPGQGEGLYGGPALSGLALPPGHERLRHLQHRHSGAHHGQLRRTGGGAHAVRVPLAEPGGEWLGILSDKYKETPSQRGEKYDIIAAARLLYDFFQPFFSSLSGQPKNMARYHTGFAVKVSRVDNK